MCVFWHDLDFLYPVAPRFSASCNSHYLHGDGKFYLQILSSVFSLVKWTPRGVWVCGQFWLLNSVNVRVFRTPLYAGDVTLRISDQFWWPGIYRLDILAGTVFKDLVCDNHINRTKLLLAQRHFAWTEVYLVCVTDFECNCVCPAYEILDF